MCVWCVDVCVAVYGVVCGCCRVGRVVGVAAAVAAAVAVAVAVVAGGAVGCC